MQRYTEDHEYLRLEGDVGTVCITHHAQEQLGDVVFVELAEVGKTVNKGDEIAVVESVKAASEIYAPVSGEILAVNDALSENPSLVNDDAEGEAWFFKIKLSSPDEIEFLIDEDAYKDLIA